ncbi:MAG: MarR family winged helix-turn-helix transcriptional regulator [Gammaproteobacteria bacterium]
MIDLKRDAELRQAIELMYFAYRAFTNEPDRLLAKRGLNRVHHRILYFVARNPGISVNELLAILDVSKQALNQPMRQLLEMGLVNSTKATYDGRVRLLSLSDKGTKLEKRLTDTQINMLSQVFKESGDASEQAWLDVMRSLAAYTKA